MTRFDASIVIKASRQEVWDVLAALDSVAQFDPTVSTARIVTVEADGVGSTRELELANGDRLRESVTTWKPGRFLDLHTYETSLPIVGLDRSYTLDDEAKNTRVTMLVDYKPKFGFLGSAIDSLYLRGRLTSVYEAGLYGLKRHIEAKRRKSESIGPA